MALLLQNGIENVQSIIKGHIFSLNLKNKAGFKKVRKEKAKPLQQKHYIGKD